jgi:hypothetical protein
MVAIGVQYHSVEDHAYLVVPSRLTSFAAGAVSVSQMITAFTGHIAYFNIIDEMRKPNDFPKALAFLQIAALSFYIVVAVVIYSYMGQHVSSPALGSASPLFRKICYGISLPTIVVAGVINAHICAKRCHDLAWRRQPSVTKEKTFRAWASWLAFGAGSWVLSWLIAESIPVFNDMLGVIGAGFTAWFCLGFNNILWFHLQRKIAQPEGKERSKFFADWRRMVLFAVNATMLGAAAAIVSLAVCSMDVST